MAQEEPPAEKLTMTNTKKEMLAAYNDLLKRLKEKRQAELKPEQRVKEKKDKEAVEVADSLSTEGIASEIGTLKSEIGKMLAQLSDRMEEAIAKYTRTKRALEVKEQELKEIYDIERAACSLAALIEAQKEKREQFEAAMAEKKEELEYEIESTREEWQEETAAHQAEVKERDDAEKKRRAREAEEHKYKSDRQLQVVKEDFAYQKAKLEREIQLKQEEMEKELLAREKAVVEGEADLGQLRGQVAAFPKELDAAVKKAVEEATRRLAADAQTREELLKKEADGEQRVLNSRIESLQQTVKEQAEHIARLSAQIEKSYTQVQDIAVKAIEGSANVQALASLQRQVAEKSRSQANKDE